MVGVAGSAVGKSALQTRPGRVDPRPGLQHHFKEGEMTAAGHTPGGCRFTFPGYETRTGCMIAFANHLEKVWQSCSPHFRIRKDENHYRIVLEGQSKHFGHRRQIASTSSPYT